MAINALTHGINNLISVAKENPVATAVGAAGAGVVLGVGTAAVVGAVKQRKAKRRKSRNSRKRNSSSKRRKKRYKYARTAGKRKDTSRKRIRMTKTGQPYVILANGRARFIKKSSARSSRRRKGGRY